MTKGSLAVICLVLLGTATEARASGLDACNNVFLTATAHCQVEPPGLSCQTRCTPLNMQVSCAKQLFTECAPECTLQVVPQDVQVCTDTCVPQCTVNPGSFDCSASCDGTCTADCSAKCSAASDSASCLASCQATCTGYCKADCSAVLPSMTCQEKCQKSCHGVHTAKVNMDCQMKCHTVERYTSCETKLTGGCQTQCQAKAGALFCDGQYVDLASVSNNVQSCIDALKSKNIVVDLLSAVGLEACGPLAMGLTGQCKVEPPGLSCDTRCTPVAMQTTCSKQLFNECSPQCTLQVVPQEVKVCADTCTTQCNVNPGSFDCSASCSGQCTAGCSAKCSAGSGSECMASCQASCSGYCEADCRAVFPSMTCQQKCQQSCHAVQVAKVNLDCQLKCQTVERYTNCKTKLTGGCKTQCASTDGALFCGDQYMTFTSALQSCIDALKSFGVAIDDWRIKLGDLGGCAAMARPLSGVWTFALLVAVPAILFLLRRRRRTR